MLSSIYSQADFVILGGGFHKGIHNSLEAAVYDTPIFFGPKFEKFKEAKDLIFIGAAQSGVTYEEMRNFFSKFTTKPISSGGKKYVQNNTGATKLICDYLLELVQKK
jgi:3-deoxy-D-manno-octulosonic-acid transferase